MYINKDNILDLIYIYIQFIITHYIGEQNILSPTPHIFEWGGGQIPPTPHSDAPIYNSEGYTNTKYMEYYN